MTQVGEAIARYHKLIESEPYIDLAWAKGLEDQIKAAKLSGRPISPVLRPHFLSNRDYTAMAKAAETVLSAIARVEQMALANPALLARLQLLPAERLVAHSPDAAPGVLFGETLDDLYFDSPPVREFRKKYKLKKMSGAKPLLAV